MECSKHINEYKEYFLGVKDGRCVRLTTYHHPVPLSRNLETLTSWNPLGLSRLVMGLLYLYIASMEVENSCKILVKESEVSDFLGALCVHLRTILNFLLKKYIYTITVLTEGLFMGMSQHCFL